MFKTIWKLIKGLVIIFAVLYCTFVVFYLTILPFVVSNPQMIKCTQNCIKKLFDADLIIEKPILYTKLPSNIKFSVNKVYFEKNKIKLLDLNNFNTDITLGKIFSNKITVNKLTAESFYADISELEKILPKSSKQKKHKNNINIDVTDALLGVRSCEIIFNINTDTKVRVKGQHIGVNNAIKTKKNVYFQLISDIYKKNNHVVVKLNDNGNVFFQNKHFYIKNCPISINNSNIFINFTADKKQNYNINLYSDKFNIKDIIDFLNTQIVENNVQKDVLSYFEDIKGFVDFKLNICKQNINGNFKIKNVQFKIKDIDNIPITLNNGNILLSINEIKLENIKGYYDNNPKNKIDFKGTVKNYLKTVDTDIIGNAIVRNDFFKNHLSKILKTDIEIKGEAPTRLTINSKNNIMDFVWFFMLKPGQNIKIANNDLPFEDSLRLMKTDMHFENMMLDIKSLDYHLISKEEFSELEKNRGKRKQKRREKHQPIFKMRSQIDLSHNNDIKFINFEIPNPLPSELLNAIFKQELFKKGKISGHLYINNKGKYPILNGKISVDRVLIPSQMIFIKEAFLNANGNYIYLNALGGYRRAKFSFDGNLINELKLPIVVKNVNLSLENIDLFKALETYNNQSNAENVITTDEGLIKIENTSPEFDIRNLIIEQARFHLNQGSYKDITFNNLDAVLTLNKHGILDIKSNRFNFAEGISSIKASFDLVNKKYNVKLGFRDINSNMVASALLDLKNEIIGKAAGFMDLYTDESMKLNGTINFDIANGTIEKIGLVEYVLRCASIFRNTVTMINPAIFADIVNVPKGNFDKITGSLVLKNNIATKIKIKTFSPQLSTYIAGRYNIDNGDTSLRVYVKFSDIKKGLSGLFRKISLDSLANRVTIFNNLNDINYYAVELSELPDIDADEKDCQIYLTRFEGDVVNNNYISSLKKIK